MNLIISLFHWSDLSRSRAMVQEMADESIKARRKLDETTRKAARALDDAKRLDEADFRMKFEKRLTPQSAFLPSLVPAGTKPTRFDAWEYTHTPAWAAQRVPQPKGRPTIKPAENYPIRSFYVEHPKAA